MELKERGIIKAEEPSQAAKFSNPISKHPEFCVFLFLVLFPRTLSFKFIANFRPHDAAQSPQSNSKILFSALTI